MEKVIDSLAKYDSTKIQSFRTQDGRYWVARKINDIAEVAPNLANKALIDFDWQPIDVLSKELQDLAKLVLCLPRV